MRENNILRAYNGQKYDKAMATVYKDLIDREFLFKKINFGKNSKVLEVCCGTGLNFRYYPKKVEVIALDIHPKMLKIASKRAKKISLLNKLMHRILTLKIIFLIL